ncbi:MAG: HAD hydrolase-like protein [Clostridia bacterium]|nr:HAD hydrolase-like protein [Clostridia bacterium]
MRYEAVIFDFDGTIADTAAGIFESVLYALDKMSLPEASPQTLRRFIGPPLDYSFQTYIGLSARDAETAVRFYRENYSQGGKYKLKFYPGIPKLLLDLRAAGVQTCLASAKPDLFIQQILTHFSAQDWFDHALGMPMAEQSADKSGVIRDVIDQCTVTDRRRLLMVGDTKFDIRGAKTLGLESIGVLYGYGTRAELVEEGADYLADSAEEIGSILICGNAVK